MSKSQPTGNTQFFTIGNAFTIARLVLLPVIVAGIAVGLGWLAVGGMAAALFTDLVDGRISRRLGQASQFGATLDSTIDFVLIYSLFIAFYAAGRMTTYQFAIIYVAMLSNLMLQLGSLGSGKSAGVVRTITGKIAGALQYTYLLFLVAREVLPKSHVVEIVNMVIFILLAAAIIISAFRFVIRLKDIIRTPDDNAQDS